MVKGKDRSQGEGFGGKLALNAAIHHSKALDGEHGKGNIRKNQDPELPWKTTGFTSERNWMQNQELAMDQ